MTFRKMVAVALSCLLGVASFFLPGSANAQASVTGEWTRLQNFPVIPIHTHLLPTGKVMMWGRPGNQGYLWDPATQGITALPPAGPGYDVFCAGHAFLPDGKLLVAGGHVVDFVGLANASMFDPATNVWSKAADMNAGRWYPTVTTLPNGDAVAVSGQIDTTVGINALPQVYQAATNTWRDLTNAQLNVPLYARMFVAPNGKLVIVGPGQDSRWLDTAGTGSWTWFANRSASAGWGDSNSAAMYAAGKILVVGGADPPVKVAEVIDLNVPAPVWRTLPQSMGFARRHHNVTLLPDGTVFVNGGSSGAGFNNSASPVFASESWNPATESWTRMATATVPRLYHSMALLLPDGRVITGGGDGYPEAEVFSPPYLYKGARPVMSAVPASMGYGQQITVQTPDAASIQKVTLIRTGSVTHGVDQNARMTTLQFTPGAGSLSITAPANGNLAPPGHYMLFIVNGNGVPSVGAIVLIGTAASPPPPAPVPVLSSLAPSSASAGGPAFTLTANGGNFISGSAVHWNGVARTTTLVGTSQLSASITAADIAAPGTAQVTVVNPGGAVSGALPFTVTAAAPGAPTLSSLAPSSAAAGGPAFTLTANGTNFVSGSAVHWNGTPRTTTVVGTSQLSASIAAADIAAPGTAQVTVVNPGGAASGALPFTVTAAAPGAPTLGSLAPSTATAGGPAFTLTANGSNFVSGSAVRWNGVARTTTFVSATQLTAAIAAADIAAAGTAQVSVLNPGGAASGAMPFTVTAAPISTFALTVTKAGTGKGSVSSTPAGINCGAACTASFASGTTVTLTAKVTGRGSFGGWTGACTGTTSTCTVPMNAAQAVTATFIAR